MFKILSVLFFFVMTKPAHCPVLQWCSSKRHDDRLGTVQIPPLTLLLNCCDAPIRCPAGNSTSQCEWGTWGMCTAEKSDSLLLNFRVFASVGSAGKLSQQDLDFQHYWGHRNFIWSCGRLITLKIEQKMLFNVWGIYVCWKKSWRN